MFEGDLYGSVRGKDEHSGMAVEDADNMQSSTGEVEARLRHLHVRVIALLVVGVEDVQVEGVGAKVSDVDFGGGVGHAVEDLVGALDVRDGLEGEVTDALDSGSDHD